MDLTDSREKGPSLEPLHRKQLEMLVYFRDFCAAHGLVWSLAFGSALGAVRHGGPIPWDDDVDVMMPAADYDRFRQLFRQQGDRERFYLQEALRIDGMIEYGKLRMNHTAFIQPQLRQLDMHQGIFMDIFLLHDEPPTPLGRLAGRLAGYVVELRRMSLQHYDKRRLALPLMAFLRLLPPAFGMKTALRLMYRSDGTATPRCISWGIPFRCFDRAMLFPARSAVFGGEQMPVPNRAEAYLTQVYGDWRTPPDETAIRWDRHSAQWSVSEDFRTLAPNIHSFADEIHLPAEKL